jgi:hypothetical protein
VYSTLPTNRHLRRQRQRQLPTIVSLEFDKQAKIGLHPSDVYRCVQGNQPLSVVFELLAVRSLRAMELKIDASEKFNCVVHEMWDVTCVLVQKGERTREVDEPTARQSDAVQGTMPRRKSMSKDKRTA